jgi:uncharacterized phage protein gp47/JayE
MPFGVTDLGFVDKPLDTILQEIEDAQKASIGAGFDVSAVSPAGQLNGIFAAKVRELWEVAQAVYAALNPDTATKAQLTALAAFTGTLRLDASKTTVVGRLNLNAGVTVPAGSIASVSGNPSARFVTLVDVTNSGGGAADFLTTLEAETAGEVPVNAGTLTVIETAVSGWNSITNDADGVTGDPIETDGELRSRREDELRRAGAAALDAIRTDVLAVTGVEYVTMYENTTDTTDADGLPPHSFETVVDGGLDAEIAQAIWDTKPAGIQAYGTSSADAVDSQNVIRSMGFTRPTNRVVYLDVDVSVNTDPLLGSVYPTDGDDQIKTIVANFATANWSIGDDVVLAQLYSSILSVDGVVDVVEIRADFTASPVPTANLVIAEREISDVQTTNIVVAVV